MFFRSLSRCLCDCAIAWLSDFRIFIDASLNLSAQVDTLKHQHHVSNPYRSDFSSSLKLETPNMRGSHPYFKKSMIYFTKDIHTLSSTYGLLVYLTDSVNSLVGNVEIFNLIASNEELRVR